MPTVLNTARLLQLIESRFGSQVEFAKKCGVSKQYMNRVVQGEVSPSLERVMQFADLFDVTVDELLIRGSRE